MLRALLLTVLCVVAYAPALTIPLIEDDYPNISQSRGTGPVDVLSDPTFRLRATSYWAMHAMWRMAGLRAVWYHALSLLLHAAATLLLYRLACDWAPVRKGAFWAAAFFAIYEGHQEAVMWFSAINELLLFVFGMGAAICWLRAEKSPWMNAPGIMLSGLALLSKESAAVLLPLLLLVRWRLGWSLAPYACAAGAAVLSIVQSRAESFRFSDGSFSWRAPFWITWPRGGLRLLWFWGMLALVLWIVRKQPMRPVWLLLLWMGAALAPYSFLTYSTAIPSRQVYLASAGLAMLAGLVFRYWCETADRRLVWAIGMSILIANVGILWTKKRVQFWERAAPTERLLLTVRSTKGPIDMRGFPRPRIVAEEAVRLAAPEALPRLVWDGTGARDR